MKKIKFLRKQAGLTLKELEEMTGISYSLISKYEREEDGGRKPSDNGLYALAWALGTTKEFLVDSEERGIYCECVSDGISNPIFLSSKEYLEQKRFGRIKEEVFRPKKISGMSLDFAKTLLPHGWAASKEMAERPRIKRVFYIPESAEEGRAALKQEVEALLPSMNERQLEKTLLIIKEVILK